MTDDVMKAPSNWRPETDLIRLAVLGKLAEELAEAGAIVARCIIQGIEECEPETGLPNRIALEKELADVQAAAGHAIAAFNLDTLLMQRRAAMKFKHKQLWHDMIRRGECG